MTTKYIPSFEVVAHLATKLFVAHSYRPEDCFKLATEFLQYREAEFQKLQKSWTENPHE